MFFSMSAMVGTGCTGPGQIFPGCGVIGVTAGAWPRARCAVSLLMAGALGLPKGQESLAKCCSLAQPGKIMTDARANTERRRNSFLLKPRKCFTARCAQTKSLILLRGYGTGLGPV